MAIDTSIYQNIRPVETPDFMSTAKDAMTLSQMGMQRQQMQLQLQQQQALRQAYMQNTKPDGSIDTKGVALTLGQLGMGQQAQEQLGQNAKLDEAQAKAQQEQYLAGQQRDAEIHRKLQYVDSADPASKPQIWQTARQDLINRGIIHPNEAPETYNESMVADLLRQHQGSMPQLNADKTVAEINKTRAETAALPVKIAADMYGSRSPNAELTSQYDKQAGDIRKSQMAMGQMIDNYKNPSPQGDASLILNAFKIKFPNAPDVNSLKELSESQAASDQWKQMAAKALKGGLDQNTRDNLMRDGISTFRANRDTLAGIQKRFQDRQRQQGIYDPTLTAEPAIDKTYAEAMELQKGIGKYVPPTERDGVIGTVSKFASRLMGGNAESTANAGEKQAPQQQAKLPHTAVKPGDVRKGYVFNGGDPSNPANWKKRGQ